MKQEHGVHDSGPFYIVREPVQLTDGDDLACLLSQMSAADVQPALIILDTFARCFVGGDENSAMEVGRFIEQARLLNAATGATVVLVHHSGKRKRKGEAEERGSSALRGAMDTIVRLTKTGTALTVRCEKMKDDEEFEPIHVRLLPVTLAGTEHTSCVLEASEAVAEERLSAECRIALNALMTFDAHTAPTRRWQTAIPTTDGTTLAERTFHNRKSALIEGGFVERVGNRGIYRVTAKGTATAGKLPSSNDGGSPTTAATATTPEGWQEQGPCNEPSTFRDSKADDRGRRSGAAPNDTKSNLRDAPSPPASWRPAYRTTPSVSTAPRCYTWLDHTCTPSQ